MSPAELCGMPPECAPMAARVFVYDLPSLFRDNGHYDCSKRDCAYGGPPKIVRGIEQWNSGQYNMPWMMLDRMKTSALRTTNVSEADIFFVPVWARSKRDCIPPSRLWSALVAQNPRLLKEGRTLAPRHMLVDLHNTLVCSFMMDDVSEPAKWFTRTNLEVDDPTWHLALDSRKQQYVLPDDCNDAQACVKKPWHWYAFPFPTAYHGVPEQCPARSRPRGYSRFLWSHVVGAHGSSVELRANLAKQCASSARCLGWDATSAQDNKLRKGVPKSKGVTHRFNDTRLVELMMDSTFCAQPSGDSATRKGLVDSIVFGCIPVVFVHRQTTLWLAHMSREEFLSFAVFVPEAYIIGTGAKGASVYGKADAEDKAEVFRYTRRERGTHPPGGSLETILTAMPEAELHRRQAAMAKVAPRMLLALEDGGCDALDTIFRRMLEDAKKLDIPAQAETLTQPTASLQMPVTPPAAGGAVASNAVVIISSSTSPKYFLPHIASVASSVLFNPGLPVHVHTAYEPQLMLDELMKLPFFQVSGASALQQVYFHALSPRPSSLSEAKRVYRTWKLQLLNMLPARRSLYLDGDIITCRNLDPVFRLLDEFELVCSHSHLPHTSLPKFGASPGFRNAKVPSAFTGCNGGVLGARNGSAAHQNVLQRWASCVSDGRDRYDMPCLAALMWRNPTKNYYVLPPEFNVRPSLGVPAGGQLTEPWLVHTLYGGGTVSQQLGQLPNGTCLQRLRDAGVVGPTTVAARAARRKQVAHVRGTRHLADTHTANV